MPTWVSKQPQKLDLPQDPRRVRDMVEYIIDLFNGHFLPGLRIKGAAHHAIAALAYDFLDVVSIRFSVLREEFFRIHPIFQALLRSHDPVRGDCKKDLGKISPQVQSGEPSSAGAALGWLDSRREFAARMLCGESRFSSFSDHPSALSV